MKTRWLAIPLLTGTLTSCVMTKEEGDVLKRDVDQLKTELSAVQRQQKDNVADQEKRLASMETRVVSLEATLNTLRQADADNGVQMEKVIAELQILRGEVEEARFALQETKTQLGETKRSVQDILARPPIEVQAAATAPTVGVKKSKTIGGEPVPEGKQALYDFSKKLFDAGKLDDAVEGFTLFVDTYSDDRDLIDNAYFWLGEAHYARAQKITDSKDKGTAFKKAILSYQRVIEVAGSNKADGALLKLGLAFEGVGYGDDARVFYEELIAKHPKSSLVADAKKRLAALDKAKPKKGGKKGK